MATTSLGITQPTPTTLPAAAARLGRPADPRLFQLLALSGLLIYGWLGLQFAVSPAQVLTLMATSLAVQALGTRWARLPHFDPKSPLISSLSLSLLLRTDHLGWAVVAAAVAIGSKFLLRARGKHIFNPTNLGLVVVILATDRAWVSPGQWGQVAFFAFLLASLGGLVVYRAARADVTLAFLASFAGLLVARALWLGDPLAIPLHQLQSGALLLFAFFMISDPKTTPSSRAGRLLFAALVALGAAFVQFRLFRQNGLLYSLVAASLLVPLIDRLLPGERYEWAGRPAATTPVAPSRKESPMRRLRPALMVLMLLVPAATAHAFCGFYVARADTRLFNQASQVVLVRDGDRTVLTMANDFQGELSEFAVVIPVPTFITREQIHVADRALIDHLDAYSAPRLVEYFDPNPCERLYERNAPMPMAAAPAGEADAAARAKSLGVTIEASYTVGEYDILILSAKQSDGLVTWLKAEGYRLPPGAEPVVGSYLKQGMRFFVARVNLGEQQKLGYSYLRPLQVAYESPKFMLPIRLGMVNAKGPQELYVYTLTRTGRVETTNYRTVRLPSGMDIPLFVKDDFAHFYRDMFRNQVDKESGRGVFLEYAWDMSWCDPCAADPLSNQELRELGAFWVDKPSPYLGPPGPGPRPGGGPQNVFLTRLHLRYDNAHFPEDLVFQETGSRENFQGRYVLRHPWTGDDRCSAAEEYRRGLPRRFEAEAQTLAKLTGWDIAEVRRRVGVQPTTRGDEPWWKRIWGDGR